MRTTLTRVAVACTATLASALVGAQAATADDETTADPVESTPVVDEAPEPPAEEPVAEEPVAEEPVAEEPVAEEPAEERALPTAESTDDVDDEDGEEVEAQYGFQKFRVGVTSSNGKSTQGSIIKISITDEEPFECVVGPPDSDGASWCETDRSRLRAASSVEVSDESPLPIDQRIILEPGATATLTQTKAVNGLQRTTTPATIAPCDAFEDTSICTSGVDDNDALLVKGSTVLFTNDPRSGSGSGRGGSGSGTGASATSTTTALPDTGASEGTSPSDLALGALMLAGGGYLLSRGRRPVDARR